MDAVPQNLIAELQAQIQPVTPKDSMAEAGRKVLLAQFVRMLQHEEGSRSSAGNEDIHVMRVATRRMRSALRLLGGYYKAKPVRAYRRYLQKIAQALGEIRNYDVLIADIQQFQRALDERQEADLQAVIEKLNAEREQGQHELNRLLNKSSYRRFLKDFGAFLTSTHMDAKHSSGSIQPSQMRHLLPTMIYSRLGSVRAYDDALPEADDTTLHALRIELKRLRYTISLFADVFGGSSKKFIEAIKVLQDHLGRLQDIVTAQSILNPMVSELGVGQGETLELYLDQIEAEYQQLQQQFPKVWAHFNTKTVQKQLALAVAAL